MTDFDQTTLSRADEIIERGRIGRYQVFEKIGQGGMGAVYLGRHLQLDIPIAIKLLHPHLLSRRDAASRFLNEARLAARLNEPAIVRVFDCGAEGLTNFIVMELVEGQTVKECIASNGRLPIPEALRIVGELSKCLGNALEQVGLIHRDIKPSNVLITRRGRIKLADLGLSKAIALAVDDDERDTNSGDLLGTPHYMSPEHVQAPKRIDHRSDIYSLGATLYEMLCGSCPFESESLFGLMQQIKEADTPRLPAEVPQAVADLVDQMMQKNPDDRFQSYGELSDAVSTCIGSDSTIGNMAFGDITPVVAADRRHSPEIRVAERNVRSARPSDDRVLIVVDIQNDFCPGGSLAVPLGDEVIPFINELATKFVHVVLTQDWHCQGHMSFSSAHPGTKPFDRVDLPYGPQTLWPDHCVRGSYGAEFHESLNVPHAGVVIRKGMNREIDSYSAFFENDRTTPTGLTSYLRERGLKKLFLVGLATDFCVAYSAIDARRLGFDVTVVEEGCRGIDLDGSLDAAWSQMTDVGVRRA